MSEETRRKGGRNPRNLQAGQPDAPPREEERDAGGRSRTAGKDRDFDESGESKNQGHGHPRERRSSGQD